ncbi:hypothetical protein [Salarchaeum sp. JOR-1]|uniref:hypothetical protein n=1 Tax=Salarchaeum sp. JOR-1 TaxID=2599399 RepID=UPI0011982FCA|nr:hypothetical protein [Salarchaeum sp. JOR-1]QDX40562.1 hypothetical protein FQU85_06475 [Salarchaeum sp. JOR-1]
MQRRTFLAGAGAAGATGLAGCSALSTEVSATTLWIDDGREVYASFSADGDEVAAAGVRFYEERDAGVVPFRAWVERTDDAAYADVRLAVTHGDPAGALYMRPPSATERPAFSYTHTSDPAGAVVALDDPDDADTLTYGFCFDPEGGDTDLRLDVALTLTTGGLRPTRWACSATRTLTPSAHV